MLGRSAEFGGSPGRQVALGDAQRRALRRDTALRGALRDGHPGVRGQRWCDTACSDR